MYIYIYISIHIALIGISFLSSLEVHLNSHLAQFIFAVCTDEMISTVVNVNYFIQ